MTITWKEQSEIERKIRNRMRHRFLKAAVLRHDSASACASEICMERASFYRMCETYGVDISHMHREDKDAYALELYNEKKTAAEASRLLGMSRSGVYNLERRLGIKFVREGEVGKPVKICKPARKKKPAFKAPKTAKRKPESTPKPMTMADYAAQENAALKSLMRR